MLSEDGSLVATQVVVIDGEEKANASIKVRDVTSGLKLGSWPVGIPANSRDDLRKEADKTGPSVTLAFGRNSGPDGHRLAAAACIDSAGELTSFPGSAVVWDVATGTELFRKEIVGRVVAISPDGKWLAAVEGQPAQLKVWEVPDSGRGPKVMEGLDLRRPGPGGSPEAVQLLELRFSPDGTRLAGRMGNPAAERLAELVGKPHNYSEIRLWDGTTGKELTKITGVSLSAKFTALAFSADGSRLAAVATQEKRLLSSDDVPWETYLWDGASGDGLKLVRKAPITRSGLTPSASAVAFTPDGERLAVWKPGSQVVRLLDTATGGERRVVKAYEANVYSVAFGPDGTRMFTVGNATRVGENKAVLKEWDLSSDYGPNVAVGAKPKGVAYVAWSRDGNRVGVIQLSTTDLTLRDNTGKEVLVLRRPNPPGDNLLFSPDGRLVVSLTASGELKVRNTETGDVMFSSGPYADGKGHGWRSLKFSPDGRRLAVPAPDGSMKIMRVADPKDFFPVADANKVYFSPDARWLVAVSLKLPQTCKLWDVDTGKVIMPYTFNEPTVTFSPDSRWFVAEPYALKDHVPPGWEAPAWPDLIVRNARTGDQQIALPGVGRSSCLFSPDGTRLLTWPALRDEAGGATVITVWSLTTGKILHRLQGHSGNVTNAAFSPDGKLIASAATEAVGESGGSGPGKVKLWDAATGRELLTLKAVLASQSELSFSPDGNRLFLRLSMWGLRFGAPAEMVWDATPRAKEPGRP
jgi:WD40 repeat protein